MAQLLVTGIVVEPPVSKLKLAPSESLGSSGVAVCGVLSHKKVLHIILCWNPQWPACGFLKMMQSSFSPLCLGPLNERRGYSLLPADSPLEMRVCICGITEIILSKGQIAFFGPCFARSPHPLPLLELKHQAELTRLWMCVPFKWQQRFTGCPLTSLFC